MEIMNKRSKGEEILLIVVGVFLLAASVNIVFEPIGMVTGGISGFAIVVKHYTSGPILGGVPIWFTNIALNIPLFIIAWRVLGKNHIKKTIFATICFTVALYIIPTFDVQYNDLLLAAIAGGVLAGVGLGMVFATTATTGGTDLLSTVIHYYVKYYTVAKVLIVIDAAIVILGAVVFGFHKAAYSVIAVYITGKVMDGILEGLKFAKLAYIISDHYEDIANTILTDMDRGVTGISTTGMYLGKDRKMLFCVVSQKEIVYLKDIVAKKDPNAFLIVSDVREVMGEGFIEYRQ